MSTRPHASTLFIAEGDSASSDTMVDRFLVTGAVVQAAHGNVVDDIHHTLQVFEDWDTQAAEAKLRCLVVRHRDGEDVGRCLAIAPARPGGVGLVTMWECVGQSSAQSTLIGAAVRWLRDMRCGEVWAPAAFTTPDRACAFDSSSAPHRESLCDDATTVDPVALTRRGFELCDNASTMVVDTHTVLRTAPPRNYAIRRLRLQHLNAAIDDMSRILDEMSPRVPIPARVSLRQLFARIEPFVSADLVQFAITEAGELAGFALAYPDHVDAARALDGDWHLGRRERMRLRSPHSAVLNTVAVAPHHRGHGVGGALTASVAQRAARLGIGTLKLLAVPDGRTHPARRIAERMGAVDAGARQSRYVLGLATSTRSEDVLERASRATAAAALHRM